LKEGDFLENSPAGRNKKPGSEEAKPHAGVLKINLVSSLGGAVSHQLSAVSYVGTIGA
jgi:hypothetical protein